MMFQTQRLTASAALAPQQPNMYLTRIRVIGGATPGALGILLQDGISTAWFPVGSNGTRSYEDYNVNQKIPGTNVPAGSITFAGGLTAVELTFSTASDKGSPLNAFRGVRNARTDGGAVTANVTITYDLQPGAPRQFSLTASASTGRITLPATGPFVQSIEWIVASDHLPPLVDATTLEFANTLVVSGISDGAATFQIISYY